MRGNWRIFGIVHASLESHVGFRHCPELCIPPANRFDDTRPYIPKEGRKGANLP